MDKSIQCGRLLNMKHILLFASYICLSLGYSETPTQYHIQTDDGTSRYFRYQTYNGQYRKEKRFEDGSVVGTYGWVDANNYLRLYNYIADENGYRIVNFKKRKVNPPISFTPASNARSPSYKPSQRRPTNFGTKIGNPREDVRRTRPRQNRPEFINSKMHPKLQPNYSRNQQRSDESEEDISIEESRVSRRRQSSPEFINSKMHPKLRPLYSRRQRSRQPHQKRNRSPGKINVHRRRQTSPEFINSKIHPKLRPTVSSLSKNKTPHSISSSSHSSTPSGSQESKKVPEFINSKIHPKLRPDYKEKTEATKGSFGTKRKPSTGLQTAARDTTAPAQVKSKSVPEEFRMDEPGGRISIDFDLGNQYRKEKVYSDGRVIGEHGYVDPLGILRRTFYKSGPDGLNEKKVSYWVGTRSPGS